MGKRVGLRDAKRVFRKRSKRSQIHDRRHTSKKLVYPLSSRSHLWRKHPDRYDMVGVDTKSRIPKALFDDKVFIKFGSDKTLGGIKQRQREILTSFSRKTVLPMDMSTKQLKKISGVKTKYRKRKSGYTLYIRPKSNRFVFVHPIVVQKPRGGWF